MSWKSDKLYGRKGGRMVDDGPSLDQVLAEVHDLRLAGIADGSWPTWTDDAWRAAALDAEAKQAAHAGAPERFADGFPLSPYDHRAIATAAALDKRDRKGSKRRLAA